MAIKKFKSETEKKKKEVRWVRRCEKTKRAGVVLELGEVNDKGLPHATPPKMNEDAPSFRLTWPHSPPFPRTLNYKSHHIINSTLASSIYLFLLYI